MSRRRRHGGGRGNPILPLNIVKPDGQQQSVAFQKYININVFHGVLLQAKWSCQMNPGWLLDHIANLRRGCALGINGPEYA
jgi:hypothetical protein